ncbi:MULTISPECIES: MBOAT family O-acyltransferase [Enterobacteriaceae]|uniref:MBOAT family O-acyltransferase n=1 Tax=Enterobacteriaceae TaxID=543 RepID=UPI000928B55A|nr:MULTISPECIES: MBOAT family O-acyltransferase [Enterobacteriaceae]EKF1021353.1 MBOAT family protein [Escherichia coli]ELE8645348.1 MBOAT family protein [Escherichia coli]ELN8685923.1 MBOAT family protein [Escherichia coli]ELR8751672.1 MBOAT family protein [Escherichia coli]MBO9267707.1 MBOAT family protein [Escherichia coli]
MLFNSLDYLLVFLPITFAVYNISKTLNVTLSKWIIIILSVFFYNFITSKYFPVLIISCVLNYICYIAIELKYKPKIALIVGILLNVASLCYFKYISITLIAFGFNSGSWAASLGLPLAVSFFTFQQISFLVDKFNGKIDKVNITDYLYYITFFPKLIAGPITRYGDLMPQTHNKMVVKSSEIISGLVILSIGLFKKIIISSYFAGIADAGYSTTSTLSFFEAWSTSLAYTVQIYFDFSGYSDIAIGSAFLLGIKLPINFNSPYKSKNIREFWDRWHISLSTWLRDYVYIPLGGSRKGELKTYLNILTTFIISGAWHGVGFNFIIWGLMHGIATSINKYWSTLNYKMNKYIAWFITFQFINLTWIPFRAESLNDSYNVVKAMFTPISKHELYLGITGLIASTQSLISLFPQSIIPGLNSPVIVLIATIFLLLYCFAMKNSNQIGYYYGGNTSPIKIRWVFLAGIIFTISIIGLFGGVSKSQFIYAAF